eukprot:NODE_1008_length_1064_cov_151.108858_g964_i0.p1 GENE.NODE_1008_length_1064_cov_151.108858_g964_i0~~NODE_1008_length_1064_cov_151.108858_g964_i0.p1  ORF type:complete len:325 (+),score=75.38 NODE_1008_length_1064_cov_151.108858_g964_i0:78-1052(+)
MLRRAARTLGNVLLLVEHDGKKVGSATLAAVTAGSKLGDVTALVAGENAKAVAADVAQIAGLSKVIAVEDAALAHGNAENTAVLLKQLRASGSYSHVVAPHTAVGKGAIPRAAALEDCQPVADVMGVLDETTFLRPTYAGNVICKVKADKDPVKYLTIRPTSFEKAAASGGSAAVEDGKLDAGAERFAAWVSEETGDSDKPQLTSARVVISGGRGMVKAENFSVLHEFADAVPNCAVGATRPVCDDEWVSPDMQVGQTGKVVAPELYVAVGLSGAIQHLAGMKDSKVIIAVNKDADAPIFGVADFGLVADSMETMGTLNKLVKG